MLPVWGTATGCLFRIFSPDLSAAFTSKKADKGGAFIEGVLMAWVTDPKESVSWEARSIRLKKNPSKARLFEEVCNVFRPLQT